MYVISNNSKTIYTTTINYVIRCAKDIFCKMFNEQLSNIIINSMISKTFDT